MSTRTARAFWTISPGFSEIREEPIAEPAADEVLVEALYSGVSRGTEMLVYAGRVPPNERERMRAPFQAGDFPGPVKYGYASVGRVTAGAPTTLGRVVFCLYPHQTAYTVPRASVVAVPEAVPPERAVLAANMETAINGVWDARLSLGDRVAVIGAGVVGCLVAYLVSSLRGCSVFLIDIDERKRNIALALGVPFATSTMAIEADVIFEASGAPEGLLTALRLVADEGTVVALSWFGDKLVTLPLGESFHSRRIELVSSQVGRVSRQKRGRWAPRRRLELALSLLDDPRLDVLITGETAFEDLPDTMARLASGHEAVLCQRVRYT